MLPINNNNNNINNDIDIDNNRTLNAAAGAPAGGSMYNRFSTIARNAGGVVVAYGSYSVAVVHNATILTVAAGVIGINPALLPFVAPTLVPIIGTIAFAGGYFAGNSLTGVVIDGTTYAVTKLADGTYQIAGRLYDVAANRFGHETQQGADIQMVELVEKKDQ